MQKENKKVRVNNIKIKSLQDDYQKVMDKVYTLGIEENKLFNSLVSESTDILGKINMLRMKNVNIKAGRPENGVSDYHQTFNIIE